jgi:hypothetical protein
MKLDLNDTILPSASANTAARFDHSARLAGGVS